MQSYESAVLEWDKARAEIDIKYWNNWNGPLPNEYNSDHMTLFYTSLPEQRLQ
jgi:hypothetical protein